MERGLTKTADTISQNDRSLPRYELGTSRMQSTNSSNSVHSKSSHTDRMGQLSWSCTSWKAVCLIQDMARCCS